MLVAGLVAQTIFAQTFFQQRFSMNFFPQPGTRKPTDNVQSCEKGSFHWSLHNLVRAFESTIPPDSQEACGIVNIPANSPQGQTVQCPTTTSETPQAPEWVASQRCEGLLIIQKTFKLLNHLVYFFKETRVL